MGAIFCQLVVRNGDLGEIFYSLTLFFYGGHNELLGMFDKRHQSKELGEMLTYLICLISAGFFSLALL